MRKYKEKFKVYKEVFDKSTSEALYEISKKGYLDYLVRPISTGKEANVFLAKNFEKEDIAVKIYRIQTSNFQNMWKYICGDDRFTNVKKDKQSIVIAWTKKEFKNLILAEKAGVSAPKPITFNRNVLLMEFIGENGIPAKIAKKNPPKKPKIWIQKILKMIKDLYQKSSLIHGDLSEYNILNYKEKPILIDFGQAVLKTHPEAFNLLKKDIKNIVNWFKRLEVKTPDAEKIYEEIVKKCTNKN